MAIFSSGEDITSTLLTDCIKADGEIITELLRDVTVLSSGGEEVMIKLSRGDELLFDAKRVDKQSLISNNETSVD